MSGSDRPELPPLSDVLTAVAVAVMIAALLAGGGAPKRSVPGLPATSTSVAWAVPVQRLIADGSAIVCAGCLTAVLLLLSATGGKLGQPAVRICRDAAVAAGVWSLASVGGIVVKAAVELGVPLSKLPAHAGDAASLPQIGAMAFVAAAAGLLAVMLSGCRTTGTARVAAFVTVLAVIAPLLTGHAAAERTAVRSVVATTALVVHVLAVSVWIGGLAVLVRYRGLGEPAAVVPKYSRIALVAAGATGISGVVTAVIHLQHRFISAYGGLVLVKVLALAVLVGFGGWHRRRILPDLAAGDRSFRRLAIGELVVMAATVGVAVALSQAP